MKFTCTVRIVIDGNDGRTAIGLVNDLLKSKYKYEIITVSAGDKVGT